MYEVLLRSEDDVLMGASIASMFPNASDLRIKNSSFNIYSSGRPSLDALYKRVAPNAILNAGGRADEVKCHPGTREEVIGRIEKWGDEQDRRSAPVFWLSGPAGAGKSAIAQTVAERCQERQVPHANFFFFREDPSRNHASPLIATFLHQIILLYPDLRYLVEDVLSNNPLLFESTLEDQLEKLIVTPLRSIAELSSPHPPLLLLVDGLDECDSETKHSQQKILRALDKILTTHIGACPFRVLVASRDEPQIQVAFNRLSSQHISLYLNEQYSPEKDIRVFVEAQFDEIRKTHRLAHMLGASWPLVDDINYIVEKSSGQFIYAATVMRFISSSPASPKVSLDRVRGLKLSTKSPFAHLDAIYTYILTQADDQEALKDILTVQLLLRIVEDGSISSKQEKIPGLSTLQIPIAELLRRLNEEYTEEVILSCLEELTPLLQYKFDTGHLLFYHASFPDYLFNRSRSGEYFVDTTAFSHKILPLVWNPTDSDRYHEPWIRFSLGAMSRLDGLVPGVLSSLVSSMKSRGILTELTSDLINVLHKIANLCISDDDIINFRYLLLLCFNKHNITMLESDEIKALPFGSRYFHMACALRYLKLDTDMVTALTPQSTFDRQELALWLVELFDCIRAKTRGNDPKRLQLESDWSAWADSNGIPRQNLVV